MDVCTCVCMCMTLFRVLLLTVGHDSLMCVCVCVCVCARARRTSLGQFNWSTSLELVDYCWVTVLLCPCSIIRKWLNSHQVNVLANLGSMDIRLAFCGYGYGYVYVGSSSPVGAPGQILYRTRGSLVILVIYRPRASGLICSMLPRK